MSKTSNWKNQIRFHFISDSISSQHIGNFENWLTSLSIELNNRDITLMNYGVNGDTSRLVFNRLHYDVLSKSPAYVMVQFGLNDCNRWATESDYERVMPNSFKSNIEELLIKIYQKEPKKIFILTNHPTLLEKSYDIRNKEYNEVIRKIFYKLKDKIESLNLIDIEREWIKIIDNSEFNLNNLLIANGFHLSKSGNEIYKKYLIEEVIKSLSL